MRQEKTKIKTFYNFFLFYLSIKYELLKFFLTLNTFAFLFIYIFKKPCVRDLNNCFEYDKYFSDKPYSVNTIKTEEEVVFTWHLTLKFCDDQGNVLMFLNIFKKNSSTMSSCNEVSSYANIEEWILKDSLYKESTKFTRAL